MNYRAHIDGLRAIAILFVLMYHGDLPVFSSGFVGVDVFFVISGFLITSIIQQSLEKGQFSFIQFYNRRLWRLQPVFLCLLCVTLALTLLFYLPDDLIQFSHSARKASLFLANHYFKQTTTGYFVPEIKQLPLLHTWSLSVEWQCYFILPLFMYLVHRIFSKQQMSYILHILTLVFFTLSLHWSATLPDQAYYQFFSRVFEFLIGSCVALGLVHRLSIHKHVVSLVGFTALVSLFYIASRSNIMLGYPNGYTLILCIATGLLIALGEYSPKHGLVTLLSSKPLVFIGLLSYSLYIWHWVVFSIVRYQGMNETLWTKCVAYGLTFILSYFSWRFIEKPARSFNRVRFRYTLASLLLFPIALTHISAYVIKQNIGFPQRFNQELVTIYQQLKRYESADRPRCIDKDSVNRTTQCILGSKNPQSKKALMIGDSFSNHQWGFMDILAKDADVSVLAQGTSSCITLPGIYLYDWWHFKDRVYQRCYDQTQRYFNLIKSRHYDYVILGQAWGNYVERDHIINHEGDPRSMELTRRRFRIALEDALHIITASGAKAVLIQTSAKMNENVHDCFFKHIKLHRQYDPEQCRFNLVKGDADQWLDTLFYNMQKKYPNLILIDPKKVQCPNNRCRADVNGIPVYRDVGHITDYASYHFGTFFLQQFKNPLSAVS